MPNACDVVTPLYYSRAMTHLLRALGEDASGDIARMLLHPYRDEVWSDEYGRYVSGGRCTHGQTMNYLDLHGDMISYLPVNRMSSQSIRYLESFDGYTAPGRQVGKPARIIRQVFADDLLAGISDAQLERFANAVKAYVARQQGAYHIVAGPELKEWYLQDRYERNMGTLSGSCMRYGKCQRWFDLYTHNPELVRLLTKVNEHGRLVGRALLWTHPDDGTTIMDRVYGTDATQTEFQHYAAEQDWYHRAFNSRSDETMFYKGADTRNMVELRLAYPVSLHEPIRGYPYMDTMKFLYYRDGLLSNYEVHPRPMRLTREANTHPYSILSSTDGEPHLVMCRECRLVSPLNRMHNNELCNECFQLRCCSVCNQREATEVGGMCGACTHYYTCRICGILDTAENRNALCRTCRAQHQCGYCGVITLEPFTEEGICPSCVAYRDRRNQMMTTSEPVTRTRSYTTTTASVNGITFTWDDTATPDA